MKMLQRFLLTLVPLLMGATYALSAHAYLQLSDASGDSFIDAAAVVEASQRDWQAEQLQSPVIMKTIPEDIVVNDPTTLAPSANATEISFSNHSPDYEAQSLSQSAPDSEGNIITRQFSLLFSILFFCIAAALGKHILGNKSEK